MYYVSREILLNYILLFLTTKKEMTIVIYIHSNPENIIDDFKNSTERRIALFIYL